MTFVGVWRRPALVSGALSLALTLAPLSAGVHADESSTSTHIVAQGETLSQIADSMGVDQAAIVKLNGLDDENVLSIGQLLRIPASSSAPRSATRASQAPAPSTNPAPATSPASTPSRTYTVADGDTLWSIAQQFSTSSAWLVDANKLDDPNRLVVGAQLAVPGTAPAVAAPAAAAPAVAAPAAAADQSPAPAAKKSLLVTYTVQPGETLTQIARQFQLKADDIATASGLSDPNRIAVGTVLKVPSPGREHVVQAGETLRDIALAEKVDLGTLIDFNTLDNPELIRVGQVVLVPARTGQPGAQTAAAVTPTPSAPAPVSTATPTPKASPAPKPAAPLVVIAPPKGAPSDGLAGAGLKLLGSPYVWGGSSPNGFDCSGFVWYVAKGIGKALSRGMFGEYNSGSHPARDSLKPGDLVFFQNTYSAGLSHTGIYIGNNQFVHAADESAGVTISNLTTPYWSSHWFGATRLP